MRVLKRLGYRYSEAGNGDHRNDQPQGEITHRLFEIGFRRELRKNVMRHCFSMSFGCTTVNSGTFEMLRVSKSIDRHRAIILEQKRNKRQ
jgi:hypothetical protein